jgi:hypothetical protein
MQCMSTISFAITSKSNNYLLLWGTMQCCEMIATVPTYIIFIIVLVFVQCWQVCRDHFRVLIDEACRVESEGAAGGAAKLGAMPRLMECPVKLQSARSTPGSVAGPSSVAAAHFRCRLWCLLFKYWRRMNAGYQPTKQPKCWLRAETCVPLSVKPYLRWPHSWAP